MPPQPTKGIRHIDFNLGDLNAWMEGRSHEEIGRVITAIGLASQAGDEHYIEKWPFIDRIVYTDGTIRKLIRGGGNIDEVSGINKPTSPESAPPKGPRGRKKVASD